MSNHYAVHQKLTQDYTSTITHTHTHIHTAIKNIFTWPGSPEIMYVNKTPLAMTGTKDMIDGYILIVP